MQSFAFITRNKPVYTRLGMLVALLISGMVLGSLLHLFIIEPRISDAQDSRRDMVQNARIALEVMSRELKMAGYNPTGVSFDGIAAAPTHLSIRADLNGDGDTEDAEEEIRYIYEPATQQIIRQDRTGREPVAEHIQSLTLAYFDADGRPTTVNAAIRSIRLTVTASVADADAPDALPYNPKTYTLTTLVNLRNVAAVTEPGQS